MDVINRLDPRRETGDMRVIAWMGVLYWLGNLAQIFYTYFHSHPVAILLAYLLFYLVFAYFVRKVEESLIRIDGDNIPYVNYKPKLGKDKYKYTPAGAKPTNQVKEKEKGKQNSHMMRIKISVKDCTRLSNQPNIPIQAITTISWGIILAS